MDLNDKAIGAAIKQARLQKGLTQDKLSEMVDISTKYLTHLEAGRRTPSIANLYKLAIVLNMSVDSIFFPDNPDTNEMRAKITRLMNNCSAHELNILYSTIEAMQNEKDI